MTVSKRLAPYGTTIFAEMTALAIAHDAVNLGQGFPDWDGPDFIKRAANEAMARGGHDQYPPMPGLPELRAAVSNRYSPLLGRQIDPGTEVTITCGCTEGLMTSFLGLLDPGDEVVIIEPYYDSYPVGIALAGATPRYITLGPPGFEIDTDQLTAAFNERTRAIVVNTPHNPTGRMFTHDELSAIAGLCQKYDVVAICDEVYEEITFGPEHLRLATFPGMEDRTVTLSSVGKTYSLTGWKVGWAIAPPRLTQGIRAAHQFMTFTTPTPVQHGTVAALGAPPSFYQDLRTSYLWLRDLLASGLTEIGFEVHIPEGTYFMMAGYHAFSDLDDRAFARHLVETTRVALIPPSVFYHRPESGQGMVRFAFCKSRHALEAALERLSSLTR